jgi:hypothetical protein
MIERYLLDAVSKCVPRISYKVQRKPGFVANYACGETHFNF